MKAEQFSKNVLSLDPEIRFAGVMEKSGHLYASVRKNGTEEYLKGRSPEISLAQSAYIVDLRKMFTQELGNLKSIIYDYEKVKLISMPVKEHVLVISTEPKVNADHLVEKVIKYVKSVESELSLYPPSNIVNEEKKETLRNLHHSGISEDLIAEQLDLDINTVRMLIAEIK
ncbi:hypothetical protein Ngar_c06410 [Candidatus Nitrososphaera gargensis Ga9.2]|uniref:HTH luxR-type domain-containing protein n=1 Tax=Nitrososphaera gargensis (strain Ga9.2) TaxID=1237085 RepID=K0IM59_NITGG|nr:DUF6659 family protein [Candidatus Nitrososphaera gargensis]AFU57584.1 hypothetical protein Ngar_c06410 [Candidatus Nitrososphaera gargensis Ga9.2]